MNMKCDLHSKLTNPVFLLVTATIFHAFTLSARGELPPQSKQAHFREDAQLFRKIAIPK